MSAALSLTELLAEKHRRAAAREAEEQSRLEALQRGAANDNRVADLCALWRSRYHPKQRAFYDRKAFHRPPLWRGASICTRRAGKTAGGTREVLSRCLEQPGYRAIYCGQTREEVKRRAWESDTKDGFLDLLEEHGEAVAKSKTVAFDVAGIKANVNRQTLTVDFDNGSQIVLFAANHKKDQRKLRGGAKHLVWVDEAQEFLELANFIESVCSALVKDYKGETWLTGTPSEDAAGYFYEVTCEPESNDAPRPGWDVHRYAVTDNPFFGHVVPRLAELDDGAYDVVDQLGEIISTHETLDEADRAAEQLRWDSTAGATLKENNWKGDEPAFLREYRGKWTRLDAAYVYAVHAVPDEKLHWTTPAGELAPMRLDADGWLDYEASLADLPRRPGGGRYTWLVGAGLDFGYLPHPFALTAWSFCLDLVGIWELFSWKKTKLLPDDQKAITHRFVNQVGGALMVLVGDPGGQKNQDLIAWKERFGLPIEPADKAQKATWQEMLNGDIRGGLAHFRKGSPMLHEMRHLVKRRGPTGKWVEHADRALVDGTIPGNDTSDAGLYSSRHIHHFLARPPEDKPIPGTAEALRAEAKRHVDAIEEAAKNRAAEMAWNSGTDWSF